MIMPIQKIQQRFMLKWNKTRKKSKNVFWENTCIN